MKMAIEAVKNGAKLRRTASQYGVPVMSLHDHIKKGADFVPRLGNKAVFTVEQEADMRNELLKLSKAFYGLTPAGLRKAAFEFAERNQIKHPFNKEKKEAGKDWFYGFLRRNPEISIRVPEPTSISRITAFNATEMTIFFQNLTAIMDRYHVPPHMIFNVDETGVTTVHKPGKILAQKGQKQVGAATSWERGKNITVCCCMSATGQFIPPLFIFPRLRMTPALDRGGPSGSLYKCSKSGWMVEELFFAWLEHFVNYTKPSESEPVLLILDNHASHISLNIYEYCRLNFVLMLSIPPHTSHRTQPLDLTFYGPLKIAYHKECDLFMKSHNYVKLSPYDIAPLFTKAYLKTAVVEKAVNGFEAAGIWPINPDKFADLCYLPEETSRLDTELSIRDVMEASPSTSFTNVLPNRLLEPICIAETPSPEAGPSTPAQSRCMPEMPSPSARVTEKKTFKGKGTGKKSNKQHSEILTSTPMKYMLEAAALRKTLKNMKQENTKLKKGTKKPKDTKKTIKKTIKNDTKDVIIKTMQKHAIKSPNKPKSHIRKIFNSSTSDSDDHTTAVVLHDDDDTDGEYYDEGHLGVTNELCAICGEFGKDNELWYRCIACARWVHALCSDKDVPDDYICSFCKP